MAHSKHAHLRYNILDYCFRKKNLTFSQLLEYVNEKIADHYPGEGINERTLRKDLKVFRDPIDGFNAPLPDNIRILKYDDPNFSIAMRPLLAHEQYLIDGSIQLLERFENHPKYSRLAESLLKFQDEEDVSDQSKILYYDINEEYKGIKHLKPLYLAIKKEQALKIVFKGYHNEAETEYEFHPQILKQYNRRWFVFGSNIDRGIDTWSIPLDDRLLRFETLDDKTYIDSTVDWESFFRSVVGVVRPKDAKPVRVVLKFYNGRKSYFTSKPFHPDFDEFFDEEKQDQVWFESVINRELVQQILSYGKDVEVIEPYDLIQEIKKHIEEMFKNYDK